MKRASLLFAVLLLTGTLYSQAPQKLSFQAVVRNSLGNLVQSGYVGLRITVLQGTPGGTPVYSETHSAQTNINGLVSLEIGAGATTGNFSGIDWSAGPYFLQTEIDPAGGTNYTITGVSQLISVPYALYSEKAGNGFSGDYNDLINKPVTDGSETRIQAGAGAYLTGTGTVVTPYIINNTGPSATENKIIITGTQNWTVPPNVSRIKVELWGGAGGGGGAGAYSYSLNTGGNGGSGGFARQDLDVTPAQLFSVVIGDGGTAGNNASWSGYWWGDSDGSNGGDSYFGPVKAAGGTGGKKGSYSAFTQHGSPGTDNIGTITGYCDVPGANFLNMVFGYPRTYLSDRALTSKPGTGGVISGYSFSVAPLNGEGGCAIITFIE